RHDVDGGGADVVEVVGGHHQKSASVHRPERLRARPALGDEPGRDVAEDHSALRAGALERAERDEPVAAADVEHVITALDLSPVENPVSIPMQLRQQIGVSDGILPTAIDPTGPDRKSTRLN